MLMVEPVTDARVALSRRREEDVPRRGREEILAMLMVEPVTDARVALAGDAVAPGA